MQPGVVRIDGRVVEPTARGFLNELSEALGERLANVDEAASVVRTRPEMTEPDPRTIETYDALHAVYRSVYAPLREDMHRLAALAGSS